MLVIAAAMTAGQARIADHGAESCFHWTLLERRGHSLGGDNRLWWH